MNNRDAGRRHKENACSVEGCTNACWREVCNSCSKRIRYGALPEQYGIHVNPPCSVEGCDVPRYTTRGSMCRGHYGKGLEGVDPRSKRNKRRNNEPPPECSEKECTSPGVSKGMCKNHYQNSKYDKVRNKCRTVGCEKYVKGVHCAQHLNQQLRYGISWVGPRPSEEISRIRQMALGRCKVLKCEGVETSLGSEICRRHRADRSRKNCTPAFYLELMSREECESCGSTGRLVVDHDHSCHSNDTMCEKCIRGRLCNGCNTALGYVGESEERLLNLAAYIKRFR